MTCNQSLDLRGTSQDLTGLVAAVNTLTKRIETMSAELEALQTEVSEATTVMEGAKTLLQSLSAEIIALKDNPAKLVELAQSLDAKSNELAQAIVDNTPTPPAPPTP
jgi:chromosome segregation ATPase